MKPRIFAAALLIGSSVPGSAQAPATNSAHAAHVMTAPDQITWGACPPFLPMGAQCATLEGDPSIANALFTIRSKLPDGYVFAPHTHPTDEHVTVLAGTFSMGTGDAFDMKAVHDMPAGSFAVMPAEMRHFAYTKDGATIQIHGMGPFVLNYVNPKDDPRTAAPVAN